MAKPKTPLFASTDKIERWREKLNRSEYSRGEMSFSTVVRAIESEVDAGELSKKLAALEFLFVLDAHFKNRQFDVD